MVPILEPSNQQEAYDVMFYAFELSEKYQIPVMVRITTRLSHSRSPVTRREPMSENGLKLPTDPRQYILLPANARRGYQRLLAQQRDFEVESESSWLNQYIDGPDKSIGIVACGLAYNYLLENFPDGACPYPVLKIGQYPLPAKQIAQLINSCESILVLEEGAPLVEELLRGYPYDAGKVRGRLDGALPRAGELNPALVGKALGLPPSGPIFTVPEVVAQRPPQLCQGCPHGDTLKALNEALASHSKGRVFSDIGCYTLGALPPYGAINSCVDMGASVTMAKGASDAGLLPSVAVIGDSTFTHSGMTGLLDAVNEKTPITVIICDNETTGMTGGQSSSASGRLEDIVRGIGVDPDHVRVITPLPKQHDANVKVLCEEIAYGGVSVIVSRRECIETAKRKRKG
jgi:indolepyruvate ferredoxin oxidoreductase alpha subunit